MDELERLERMICEGLRAYDDRNREIVRLVDSGVTKMEVTRRLNRVRAELGVSELSATAVTQTCKRFDRTGFASGDISA